VIGQRLSGCDSAILSQTALGDRANYLLMRFFLFVSQEWLIEIVFGHVIEIFHNWAIGVVLGIVSGIGGVGSGIGIGRDGESGIGIVPSGGVEGRAEVVCLRDMVKIWRVGLRCLGEKILGAIVESLEARRWRLDVSRRHQKLGTVWNCHVMRRFISVETDVINVGGHVMRSSVRSSWDPRGKS